MQGTPVWSLVWEDLSGNQRSNCQNLLNRRKSKEFQKNIYFCFTDYVKAFDCVDHNKLWKIMKEMRIPDHLTCLLRNLYAGQKATVRTRHGTKDWFQKGEEYIKVICCHPAYLTCIQKSWAGWITSWNQDCQEKYQ